MGAGLNEYTKAGYTRASRSFTPTALDVNLDAKSILVTGANSGLGKICAIEFASRGAHVHLLCRDAVRGGEARDEIIAKSKNSKVELHVVDISSMEQIKKFSEAFEGKLDVLVNNAGVLMTERLVTSEGIESSFATNTLGTYFLTESLVQALERSEAPRVVR